MSRERLKHSQSLNPHNIIWIYSALDFGCTQAECRKQLTSCSCLQIFIMRRASGVAPGRGQGCTTSIPSTGSRFSRATNVTPASKGAPGLTSSTGGKGVACRDTAGKSFAFCMKDKLLLIVPLRLLLQAVQPRRAGSCGRSLGQRASVLRSAGAQHVAGQRDGRALSRGHGSRLWSARDETNCQSAQSVTWVSPGPD